MNPPTVDDNSDIIFECNTANNPNGEIYVYSGATFIASGSLAPSGFGQLTVLAANTTVGQVFTVQCEDGLGNVLNYGNGSGPCDNDTTVVAAGTPECLAALVSSGDTNVLVGQLPYVSVGDPLLYLCIFNNYSPQIPPFGADGITITNPIPNSTALPVLS